MELRFHTLDVFTQNRFGVNTAGSAISGGQMNAAVQLTSPNSVTACT